MSGKRTKWLRRRFHERHGRAPKKAMVRGFATRFIDAIILRDVEVVERDEFRSWKKAWKVQMGGAR